MQDEANADAPDEPRAVPALLEGFGVELPPDAGPAGVLEWAERYRKIDGRAFTLRNFKPLYQIYADDHPNKVIGKPAQKGASEYAINYAGFALDRGAAVWTGGEKAGLNVAYIFPKKEALSDFSKERLSGLTSETEYLSQLFGEDEFNAVTFKQAGDSYLYLRGGWSTSALKSFPADVLILDEYDEMVAGAIALARRRLNASLVKRELALSTPSIPGRGIHALYLESDRHVWEQQHRCRQWVRYDFLRDVTVGGQPYESWQGFPAEQVRSLPVVLVCPACGDDVSDAERCSDGRWVAEQPRVQGLRGYWIPPLSFPFVELPRLAAAAVNPDPSEREQFFQQDLGLPYTVSGSRVTLEMLLSVERADVPKGPWSNTCLGIDVGARWHWLVSSRGPDGRRYIRAVGAAHSWDDCDALMRHFRVRSCIVDALPELDGSKQFAARWPGRVMRAFYPAPTALRGQLFSHEGMQLSRQQRRRRHVRPPDVIQINRTMAMDRVYAQLARGEQPWAQEAARDPELQAHLTSPVRTMSPDAQGQPQAAWMHAAPDHLYHALVYATIAADVLPAETRSTQLAVGGVRPAFSPPNPSEPPLGGGRHRAGRVPGQVSRRGALSALLAANRAGQLGATLVAPPSRFGRRRIGA